MRTLTTPSRIRIAVGVMTLALATGCSGEAPPDRSSLDHVPTTLAARPEHRPQPKVELEIDPPVRALNGYAESSGDAVWQLSTDLVRDWMFNPDLVIHHEVEPTELDGLGDLMAGDLATAWKRNVHRAFVPWLDPLKHPTRRPKAEQAIQEMVLWNLRPPSTRGWRNPMFDPVRITDGRIIGAGDIGVMFQIHTAWRWMGHGLEYETPYDSFMILTWRHVDNEWKLVAADRTWRLGKEKLTGPPEALKGSSAAQPSTSATPSLRPSPHPSVVDSAP